MLLICFSLTNRRPLVLVFATGTSGSFHPSFALSRETTGDCREGSIHPTKTHHLDLASFHGWSVHASAKPLVVATRGSHLYLGLQSMAVFVPAPRDHLGFQRPRRRYPCLSRLESFTELPRSSSRLVFPHLDTRRVPLQPKCPRPPSCRVSHLSLPRLLLEMGRSTSW